MNTNKTKLDFTKDKLKNIILELANLNGYEKPSTYLNELLEEVKKFKSFELEQKFFLDIHYLCKENSENFWSESHRKDITRWLGKARILTDVFKTTWDNLTPQQAETKTEQETPKKFTANEYALTYIFDLYANGKQIPTNKTEGGYNKKVLIQTGIELYQFDEKKDTFYRAVKNVAEKFDLNKKQDLINISQSWIEAVKTLSKDWNKTEKYLKEKKLIGE